MASKGFLYSDYCSTVTMSQMGYYKPKIFKIVLYLHYKNGGAVRDLLAGGVN